MRYKYTYNDVILNPLDYRLKDAIGTTVFASDDVAELLSMANNSYSDRDVYRHTLKHVNTDLSLGEYSPFCVVENAYKDNEVERSKHTHCVAAIIIDRGEGRALNLSKKEVRDKLRGKWIRRKTLTSLNNGECRPDEIRIVGFIGLEESSGVIVLIPKAVLSNTLATADGLELMLHYEYLDGSEIVGWGGNS